MEMSYLLTQDSSSTSASNTGPVSFHRALPRARTVPVRTRWVLSPAAVLRQFESLRRLKSTSGYVGEWFRPTRIHHTFHKLASPHFPADSASSEHQQPRAVGNPLLQGPTVLGGPRNGMVGSLGVSFKRPFGSLRVATGG